jgi:cytochrome c-type biogenesis protein CcmH/NrfF
MLRGSNQSGSSLQVKRFAIAAAWGCAVLGGAYWAVLGGASLAFAQDTQAPSSAPAAAPQEAAPHVGAAEAAARAEPGKGSAPPGGKVPAGSVSDEEVERQAEALSRSLMSPFCPGRTLSACPSPNAQAWREDIRKWVRDGVPATEIRDRLTARNPEHNLTGSPPRYAKWALIGVGLLSVVVLIAALRYLLKPPPPPTAKKDSAAPPGDDKDWDAKLKQELDALDQ